MDDLDTIEWHTDYPKPERFLVENVFSVVQKETHLVVTTDCGVSFVLKNGDMGLFCRGRFIGMTTLDKDELSSCCTQQH